VAKAVEFVLDGDPAHAKEAAVQALEGRKFRCNWSDDWTAVAERGSKKANMIAGAAAQYFKVGLSVRSADTGHSIVRLEKQSTGLMGGAIGAARTSNNMKKLRDELTETFTQVGVLVERRET
jgi:hypothetical protein